MRYSDFLFKLVLIGDTCVGKSCLLVRFAVSHTAINASTGRLLQRKLPVHDRCRLRKCFLVSRKILQRFRTLQINKATTKLQIWDTAGQERYRTITNAYYKGSDGIIIVFDITNRESFLSIDSWLEEIHKNVGDDVLVMIFANKADLYDDPQSEEI